MLNVSKAKKLQGQVGAGNAGQEKIWHHANQLYSNANDLASDEKLSSRKDLTDPLDALKKAVGASDAAGLQKALKALSSASDTNNQQKAELVRKAQEVIDKFKEVKEAYDKVKAKEEEYKEALKGTGGIDDETHKYNEVESTFDQLKTAYNESKCKAISPIYDKERIR